MTGHEYTHGHHDSVLRSHRWRTADNSAAYLLPHLVPGSTLLDIGCGPGTLTLDLARRVFPGEVAAVDIDAGVLTEAAEHAEEQFATNVTFHAGDFRELDLGRFDVVHAHQVLQHLPDPVGAIRSMAERTRPGGLIAVRDCDYSSIRFMPEMAGLDGWLALYRGVTRYSGTESNAGRWLPTWFRQAGISEFEYTTSTWTFHAPRDRHWWGGLWADRAVESRFATRAIEFGLASRADLEAIARVWKQWSEADEGLITMVHGEVVARLPD